MATGTATVNFGSIPTDEATFTINDPAMAGATYVEAFFMGSDSTSAGPWSATGNTADDHKMAGALITRIASAPIGNNFDVTCLSIRGYVVGTFKLRYVGV